MVVVGWYCFTITNIAIVNPFFFFVFQVPKLEDRVYRFESWPLYRKGSFSSNFFSYTCSNK
jgi:hypothetical protein